MDEVLLETKRVFEKYPHHAERQAVEQMRVLQPYLDTFLHHLPGDKIVDMGAGPGVHGAYFQEQVKDVLCIDFCEHMVQLCKRRGLPAQLMNFESPPLLENHFDGIWACDALTHIPKNRIPSIIENFSKILKSGGIFGLIVREGEGENFATNDLYPGMRWWESHFQDEEIRSLSFPFFDLLSSEKILLKQKPYLYFLLKKKPLS